MMKVSTDKIEAENIAGRDLIINKTIERVGPEKVSVVSGMIMGAVMLTAVLIPCPSRLQYEVFRLLMAIGLFGFSSALPSALKVRISERVKVSGALVIFLIAIIWNPTSLLINDGCGDQLSVSGTVWLGSQRLAGAKVSAPLLNEVDQTNSSGEFDLPYDHTLAGDSVELTVTFRQLEKRQMATLDNQQNIRVEFADTLIQLTEAVLTRAIASHIAKSQRDVKAELKKLLIQHNRKPSSRKSVEQRLAIWEKLEGGVKNDIVFENGFLRLNTLRSVEDADLESDYLMLSTGWGMQTPQFFLINWENKIEKGENQSTVKLEVLIFNQANDGYELINNTQADLRVKTKHRVRYDYPLQLTHIKFEYSSRTEWRKQSKIQLLGHLPVEEYQLEFTNGSWEVTGVTTPLN